MIVDDALREAQAALFIAEADTCSLHTDDPGTTGDNEVAYTSGGRQSITWVNDSEGLYHTNIMTFNVPVAEIAYVVVWNTSGDMIYTIEYQEIFEFATSYQIALTYEQA